MIKRLLTLALAGLLIAGPGTAIEPAGAQQQPYVINAILSMTGSAAFIGQGEARTLKVVEAAVNKEGGVRGRPIHFEVVDDQSSPQVAVQLLNRIKGSGEAAAVIGPSLVATCNAITPILNDTTVAYCLSPGARPKPGSFLFSSGFIVKDGLIVALRYLRAKHLDRVAFLSSTDATGQDGEASFREALALPENSAIQFVANEHFNPSDISVAAQIARIKQADAQALVAFTTGTQLGTILRGAQDAGLKLPIFTSNGNMTFAQMKQYGAFFDLDNLLYEATLMFARGALPRGKVRDTVEQFYRDADADGLPVEIGTSLAWDPAILIVSALRRLGTNATAPQIRAYLAGLRDYPGANGPYDFVTTPQRGLNDKDSVVVRWDGQKNTWVPVSGPGGYVSQR